MVQPTPGSEKPEQRWTGTINAPRNGFLKEHWALGLVLLLGLIHGLIYVFTVPPWQHYDEPGQFEHAWLIANRPGLPNSGDYDQAMRREVAASMIEHGFFKDLGFRPNLLSVTEPIWIGIAQTSDPHAYYWFVALPLRLVQTSDITFQLYLGRMVSLLFYLLTIALGYAIIAELTGSGAPLRWLLPLTMVMIPGFTDMMTAVNNDVGATAFFSAFLWLSIRTIRKGAHGLRFIALLSLAVLCFFTKTTVAFAPLLAPIPIVVSLLNRGKQRRVAWGILAIGLLTSTGMTLYPGEPAFWYDLRLADNTRRVKTKAPHGEYAFKLRPSEEKSTSQLVQPLPGESISLLKGKTVTLGAWIWANQPATVTSPGIATKNQLQQRTFEVTTQPQFFSFTAEIEADPWFIRVILPSTQPSGDMVLTVYFDGILLVDGEYSNYGDPQFDKPDGLHGFWGGRSFNNLIRNGSAESSWWGARRTIDTRFSKIYPASLSTILASLRDWNGAEWYYRATFDNLFRTFWAKFGWGNVLLAGSKPYRPLGIVTLLAFAAAAFAAWRRRSTLPKSEITFLAMAGILVWGAAFFRGIGSLFGVIFIPASRYAYPAIIPTVLALCVGWYTVIQLFGLQRKALKIALYSLYVLLFLALDVLAVWSIIRYYG